MQGAGVDVDLADYNRNQCCADESASASPASAHSLGSARWRAGPSPVVGDAVRSGAKPRRVMSNLGTGGTADARVHTPLAYFAWNVSTPRGGWLEYSRNSTSSGNTTRYSKGASRKGTQETQTAAADASKIVRCKTNYALEQLNDFNGVVRITEKALFVGESGLREVIKGYGLNR